MNENGQLDNVEIIPDFDNEMIEETPPVQKSGGCGCNKNKTANASQTPQAQGGYSWDRIVLIGLGILVLYFMFKKKGAKIEVPKVEVPEV